MPPPPHPEVPDAPLPLTVERARVSVPPSASRPPPWQEAVLPLTALRTRARVAALPTRAPAPSTDGVAPVSVTSLRVSVPPVALKMRAVELPSTVVVFAPPPLIVRSWDTFRLPPV